MPKGPSGQKRPADTISRAVQIMRIATGEEKESGHAPGTEVIGDIVKLIEASECSK